MSNQADRGSVVILDNRRNKPQENSQSQENSQTQTTAGAPAEFEGIQRQVFTVNECAYYLHCNPATIRKLIRQKEIPSFRVAKKIMVRKTALDGWIVKQESTK